MEAETAGAAAGIGGFICLMLPLGTWGLCAFLGLLLGAGKNRATSGFLWGPIGLIIVAVQPYNYSRCCPDCGTGVLRPRGDAPLAGAGCPSRSRSQPEGDKTIARSKLWPRFAATQVPADASSIRPMRATLRF
jgi:hypothetical protein